MKAKKDNHIMQVTFNSNNIFKSNYRTPNYKLNNPSVSFKGIGQPLVAVSEEAFNSTTAQKLYSKIQKYFRLIGENGRVENVKVLNETSRYYDSTARVLDGFDSEADVFMSITRNNQAANLNLSRKYKNSTREPFILFNADFDKNGQMVNAKFPLEGLRFERTGNNVRRIYRDKRIYMPVSGNDKAWEHNGRELLAGDYRVYANDDSTKGAFEIFMELARLFTSIYK